ncbi:MAG: hypothetical protein U9R29_05015 [Thermodesulfobacteriota bacterium]|nr:hypothetical protein [Thermodesulfobacteriota bacterium]
MQVYRYKIKPLSAFATPMRSDTLYGQLLCAAAELDGTDGVAALIQQFTDKQPPFVLSSVFPAGKLPMPVLSGIKRPTFKKIAKGNMFDELSQQKKFRKLSYICVSDWNDVAGQLSSLKLFQHHRNKKPATETEAKVKSSRTMHNSIDRNNNRVIEGGLYSSESSYFDVDYCYDLYVKTADRESFERLFSHVATTGFGADASTGKGQFDFEIDESFDSAMFHYQGNAEMNLSVCMALETDQFAGTWNLFTKLAKVWNGFGETNPFKKPFIAFTEGSVFTHMPNSDFVLRNIHSNSDYVQIGLPLTLPLTLEEG